MTAVALLKRDLTLAFRSGGGGLLGLAFFAIAALMTPFGVGPEGAVLSRIAGGVIWVAALFAAMLTLDRLFQADLEDGSLEQLALSPLPLELVVAVKSLAHWLTTGLPLTVAAPGLGLMLALPVEDLPRLALTLLIGTPALSLIGAVGAALTVGVRRGGLLLSVIVLPLYIPTLIFGTAAVAGGTLLFLAALTLFSAAIAPFASAAALRIALR